MPNLPPSPLPRTHFRKITTDEKANLISVKCFFSKSSSRTVKYQNHDQGEGNFSKKKRRVPPQGEPKIHKSEKTKGGSAVCTGSGKYFRVPL